MDGVSVATVALPVDLIKRESLNGKFFLLLYDGAQLYMQMNGSILMIVHY